MIEWNGSFINGILGRMGFEEKWVVCVMHCMSTVSYKVTHNREEIGPIYPKRALDKGTPYPHIFFYP